MLEQATHRGLVRSGNEDAVATRALPGDGALLVVADGLGGYPGGEVASRIAVDTLVERLAADDAADDGDAGAGALRAAIAEARRRILAGQQGAHAHMSTTLVAALVRDGRACVANVGDSRAYVAGADGAPLHRVTHDHSWVEEEIRAGRLAPDDPIVPVRRHVITRSLGGPTTRGGRDGDATETGAGNDGLADVFDHIELPPGAVLLLCSDGLHGMLPDDEIAALLSDPSTGVAQRLVDAALARGGVDNVTVAVYASPAGGSPV